MSSTTNATPTGPLPVVSTQPPAEGRHHYDPQSRPDQVHAAVLVAIHPATGRRASRSEVTS